MKKFTLSRHVVITNEDGKEENIPAGEHTKSAAIANKIEAAAKDHPRTTYKLIEDLTPAESRAVAKTEAVKIEQGAK